MSIDSSSVVFHHQAAHPLRASRRWSLSTWTLSAVFFGALFAFALELVPSSSAWGLALFFNLAVGLPHGAVDHLVCERQWGHRLGLKALFIFCVLYLLVMLAFSGLIIAYPFAGLWLFILMSAEHFGQSHRGAQSRSLRMSCFGFLIISALVLGQWAESEQLLALVLSPERRQQSWLVFSYGTGVALFGYGIMSCAALMQGSVRLKRFVWELSFISLLAILAYRGPLWWSFTIYFCFAHAIDAWEDLLKVRQLRTEQLGQLYRYALPFSSLALVGAFLLWVLCEYELIEKWLLFALLLAGPVPHMLIFDWLSPSARAKVGACSGAGMQRECS